MQYNDNYSQEEQNQIARWKADANRNGYSSMIVSRDKHSGEIRAQYYKGPDELYKGVDESLKKIHYTFEPFSTKR